MNPGVMLIQRLKDLDDLRVTGRCGHAIRKQSADPASK
jgi:hypothetical protein